MRPVPSAVASTSRTGMTFTETLVVAVILVALGLLLLPVLERYTSRTNCRTSCSSNQRQLVIGMVAYATDNDQRFPAIAVEPGRHDLARAGADMTVDLTTRDAVMTTMASFELLAAASGNDLSPKVFACPTAPTRRPTANPLPMTDIGSLSLSWPQSDPCRSPSAYAYDWAIPKNLKSSRRVVLADRPISSDLSGRFTNHKSNKITVAFGDGHTQDIAPDTQMTSGVTVWYGDDRAFGTYSGGPRFLNAAADQDDVYSATGDGGEPARFNHGSVTRCFLK